MTVYASTKHAIAAFSWCLRLEMQPYGVGVGDRENVESVDLVGVGDQVADGSVRPVPEGGGIEPSSRHAHLQPALAAPAYSSMSPWASA